MDDGRACSHRGRDRRRSYFGQHPGRPRFSGTCQFGCQVIGELVDGGAVQEFCDRNRNTKLLLQSIRERNRPERIQTDFVQRLIGIDRLGESQLRHDAALEHIAQPGGVLNSGAGRSGLDASMVLRG